MQPYNRFSFGIFVYSPKEVGTNYEFLWQAESYKVPKDTVLLVSYA